MIAVTGYAAFGELSIAPKRYPLTLARVIEIGPWRSYLQRSCKRLHYEICTVMPDPPGTAGEIVFGPRGLKNIATSDQLDRIRAEEIAIVLNATAAYPWVSLKAAVGSSLRQLGQFGLVDLMVDRRLSEQSPGVAVLVADPSSAVGLRDVMARVASTVAWLSIALLPFAAWFCPRDRRLMLLIVGAIAAKAVICATLSEVADRYQGRVIWLLPVMICAVIARYLQHRLQVRAA